MGTQEFGLIGLGVMGKSLARNLGGKGFKLALYNRFMAGSEEQVAERFIAEHEELSAAKGFEDMKAFIDSMATPRKVFLMVNAGKVTDFVINDLKPLLDEGDIIIDGGNSHYTDTQRRQKELLELGIHFIGSGVSGGERGALEGPSIMPGGNKEAYGHIAPYLEAIAARDKDGNGCCTYIGRGGSGHYVKMVHNGIEYAEMQLLAEVYGVLRYVAGYTPEQISNLLKSWGATGLDSYLLDITYKILLVKEGDTHLIDLILDKAGNKGTGSWTTETMAQLGIPATLISSALFARFISSFEEKRNQYSSNFATVSYKTAHVDVDKLRDAYELSRMLNHQQGFELIAEASEQFDWDLNLSELARIWTNGCIIRSELMQDLTEILKSGTDILLSVDADVFDKKLLALREISALAITCGISMPCTIGAADFLNALCSGVKTANMIQAQRDFFGAHTYVRVDDPSRTPTHTQWEEI